MSSMTIAQYFLPHDSYQFVVVLKTISQQIDYSLNISPIS